MQKRRKKKEEEINNKTEAQEVEISKEGKERKKTVDADIKIKKWKNYFSQLLKGSKKEEKEPNKSRNLSKERKKKIMRK